MNIPGRNIRPFFASTSKLFRLLLMICSLLCSINAAGQDKPQIDKDLKPKNDNWRFIISPYALLASQATDVGIEHLRQSFGDLASLTNFGFQMAAVVMYKKWFLSGDGTYADLGKQITSGPVEINFGIKQYIIDLRIGYLFADRFNTKDESNLIRGMSLELNAGAKYWNNEVSLKYSVTPGNPPPLLENQLNDKQIWWDAMLGAKGKIFISRSFLLGISASYGGFGIGNSSKYSWDFLYLNTFRVSKILMINAGFRAFKYKRTDPGDEGDIETKVIVAGPLLGVSFTF